MRDSVSEIVKLYLGDPEGYDARQLRNAQMDVKARGETLKVLRGLCCLADWLTGQFEDGASATQLVRYSTSPKALYKTLAQLGYAWNEKSRVWRLFPNLKKTRHIRNRS